MWKIAYGLTRVKGGEQEPIEVKDDEEDEKNEGTIIIRFYSFLI